MRVRVRVKVKVKGKVKSEADYLFKPGRAVKHEVHGGHLGHVPLGEVAVKR